MISWGNPRLLSGAGIHHNFFQGDTMSEQRMVITISRQMASGGVYIGRSVARRLGYKYIDREILEKAAEQLGADRAALLAVEERCSSFVDNLVKSFTFGTPEAAYVAPSGRPVHDREVFETESRVIRAMADRYDCVVVGHAAFFDQGVHDLEDLVRWIDLQYPLVRRHILAH